MVFSRQGKGGDTKERGRPPPGGAPAPLGCRPVLVSILKPVTTYCGWKKVPLFWEASCCMKVIPPLSVAM